MEGTPNLKRERIDQGWSIKGLADHLNLSPSVIERVDRGAKPRKAIQAFAIADHFGYRVSEVWPIEES